MSGVVFCGVFRYTLRATQTDGLNCSFICAYAYEYDAYSLWSGCTLLFEIQNEFHPYILLCVCAAKYRSKQCYGASSLVLARARPVLRETALLVSLYRWPRSAYTVYSVHDDSNAPSFPTQASRLCPRRISVRGRVSVAGYNRDECRALSVPFHVAFPH